MRIGTTPTHTFELPFEAETIKDVDLVYTQNKNIILEKNLGECNCNKNILALDLTQEETFLFDPDSSITVDIRVLTVDDKVVASEKPIIIIPRDFPSRKVLV